MQLHFPDDHCTMVEKMLKIKSYTKIEIYAFKSHFYVFV